MKNLKMMLGLSGLAVSLMLVGSFSRPVDTGAFALLGHSLGTGQRDFRVFNNFTDTQANNNTTPHANFPGTLGAVQAIWKAHAEWSSVPWAGNGLGDSTQAVLGDSGAMYDPKFEGEATTSGSTNTNIHSELAGSSGGVLAFMQGGGNGWWIRYYSGWTWHDGPGTVSSGVDLQGVACHEAGHAVGLGHSNVSGATMLPSISGTGQGQRSVNNDDRAGLQAVYGTIAGSKPRITGLSGNTGVGQTLTILGTGFSTSANNDVWFTKLSSNGVPTKVSNISATSGGTVLNVTVPGGIQDGDVMVQNKGLSSHGSLSNAWPFDVGTGGAQVPFISSVFPPAGPSGGWTACTLTGSNFVNVTGVKFGSNDAINWVVDSSTQISCFTAPGVIFTQVDVSVINGDGTGIISPGYTYSFNPAPNITSVSPNSGSVSGGTMVTVSGGSVVAVHTVTFDGVPGTELTITSPTSLEVETPAGSNGPVNVVALGDGSSTIVDGFTYTGAPGGAFVNIGPGIDGLLGQPEYTGTGDLTPGSGSGYSTTVTDAIPFNTGYLFLSLTQGAAAFKGGTLYPFPIDAQLSVPMSAGGSLTLPHVIPAGQGFEGLSITVQWWFADAAAVAGASASNGLRLDIP